MKKVTTIPEVFALLLARAGLGCHCGERKGVKGEVTIKETLHPLSLGLSEVMVWAKPRVKVEEVPRVHQSCPGRLQKAVFFISPWHPASVCPAGQNTQP